MFFLFPWGLREKTLLRLFRLHLSFNCFSYTGYITLFKEKCVSPQLVLPRVQKVRLLIRNRSCVASFLPQSEIKNVWIEKHNIFTPFPLKEHTIFTSKLLSFSQSCNLANDHFFNFKCNARFHPTAFLLSPLGIPQTECNQVCTLILLWFQED